MKKILILYENTGSGHKRAAKILESILGESPEYQVVSYAGSELFDDEGVEIINQVWAYLLRQNWIRLADYVINFFFRRWVLPLIEVSQVRRYFNKLDEISPDIMICTADCIGRGLGTYSKEKSIPFYLLITEMSIFFDLVNPQATHICYFPETINAIRSFSFEAASFSLRVDRSSTIWDKVKYVLKMYKEYILLAGRNSIYRNIDREHPQRNQAKCVAIGPMVEPLYYVKKNKLPMREKFGIDLNTPCLLVISGSIGGEYLYQIVRTFQDMYHEPFDKLRTSPLTILAVCGKDQSSYLKVDAIKERNPALKVMPFGFVHYLDELYTATDVVIARPSAGILLEALTKHIPLILPDKATSNDLGGIELIKRHQLGEIYRDQNEIPQLFTRIISNYQNYVDHIGRFLAPYSADFGRLKETIQRIILHDVPEQVRSQGRSA